MNELLNDDILILDSTEGLSFIGQGNTAEIYACSKDSIVKLFRDGFPEEGVKKEWEITNKVQKVFDMMPRALKYVVHEKRYGILYEKAHGMDMFSLLSSKPLSICGMGNG